MTDQPLVVEIRRSFIETYSSELYQSSIDRKIVIRISVFGMVFFNMFKSSLHSSPLQSELYHYRNVQW